MDLVVDYLPSPNERPNLKSVNDNTEIRPKIDERICAYIFKVFY